LLVLGGLVCARVFMAPPGGQAATTPSRDINTYVLFALESLNFKGADSMPETRGHIVGGNVGVNNADPRNPPTPVLIMGGGGSPHPVLLSDGSQVVSDTSQLDSDTSVFDFFVNRLVGAGPVIRGMGPTSFTTPIIAPQDLPPFPSITCDPGAPREVPEDSTVTLPPGTYGDVLVRDRGELVLGPGTYTVCNLRGGRGVRITTDPATVVQVAGEFSTNNQSFVGPACEARFLVGSDGVGANDPSVSFGRNSEFHGQVYAPNGRIALGSRTDLFGRFWSETITSDFNANVTNCPPGGGAECGDGTKDDGEQCDDGNQVDGDGCSADCMLEEICTDLIDNDGDGLIDCFDPDCAPCPPIMRDPAHIRFRDGLDQFQFHGRVDPETPIDPSTETVAVLITNENGVIYKGILQPGDLSGKGARAVPWRFTDRKAAKAGESLRDGIARVSINETMAGYYVVNVMAWGDLSSATLADMTLQLVIGDDVFQNTGTWKQKSYGWLLNFPRFPPRTP
jgi:cysteine-rich repeat protein